MKVEIELEEQEEMEVEDVVTELGETNLDDNSPEEVRVRSIYAHPPNIDCRVTMAMAQWKKMKMFQRRGEWTKNWKSKWMKNKKSSMFPDHSAPS